MAQTQTRHTAQLTPLRHAAGAMIRAILIMSSLAGAMVSTPRLRAQDVGDAAALHTRFVDYSDELCGNQPVRLVHGDGAAGPVER